MSQENAEIVQRAIAALNERDIDGYLSCCTDDVELHTPLEVYAGHDGLRRYFADLGDISPDFEITFERLQSISDDRVLALMRVTATGRASGIHPATGTPTGNVYDLDNGRIKRVRIFSDRNQALEAVGLSE